MPINAQAIIDSLTNEERAYFIACTDIFHDSPYSVIGRPSVSNQRQNTITLNLEQTLTVNSFPSLNPNNNWDVNIVSLPFLTTQRLITVDDIGYVVNIPTANTSQTWGGVTSFASQSGTTIIPASSVTTLNADAFFYPEYTPTPAAGQHVNRVYYEVLSAGIEIINTTPELNRGGNVTRYRVPTQGRRSDIAVQPAGQPSTRRFPFCYPMPPTTEALASQYPDTVLDEARAGSYQMHTIQDQVSDFYLSGNSPVFFSNPDPATPGGFNSWLSKSAIQTITEYDPPLVRGDLDIVGSYFTGLTPQTNLKIRARYIVSMVPSSASASLTSLAKISPDYNPALDQLISMLQAEFTPGIESAMNASGDWWKVVLKGIAKVAPTAGKALGGKTGETIGEGVSALARTVAKDRPKKKTKSAPKQTQNKQKKD